MITSGKNFQAGTQPRYRDYGVRPCFIATEPPPQALFLKDTSFGKMNLIDLKPPNHFTFINMIILIVNVTLDYKKKTKAEL